MLTITPSNIKMIACHRKFAAAIKHQFPAYPGRSSALRYAIGLHDVLRMSYDPATTGPLPHLEGLPLYVKIAFMGQAYREEQEREMDMLRAHRLAKNYMEHDEEAEYTTGVECRAKYDIEIGGKVTYQVSARLDRVIEMPDGVVIARDYTTGIKALSVEQVWCNLVILRLLRPGRTAYRLEVDRLNDDNIVDRVVYPAHHLKGIVKMINAQILAFQQAEEYKPTLCDECLYCPLAESCLPQPPAIQSDQLDWD